MLHKDVHKIKRWIPIEGKTGIVMEGSSWRWEYHHKSQAFLWSSSFIDILDNPNQEVDASLDSFIKLIHPEDQESVRKAWTQSIRTEESYSIEYRLKIAQDSFIWISEYCRTEFDKNGNPIRSVGILHDISDWKTQEEQLNKEKDRLQDVLSSIGAGTWEVNLLTGDTKRNKNWYHAFGYNPTDSPPHQNFGLSIIHPNDQKKVKESIDALIRGDQVVSELEVRLKHKQRDWIWVISRAQVISFKNGISERLSGIDFDISDQKKKEQTLQSWISLLNATLESIVDGILIINRFEKVVKWNRKGLILWNLSESLVQEGLFEKVIQHMARNLDDPAQFNEQAKAVYANPQESSFRQVRFADGKILEWYSKPQYMGNAVVGSVWSFCDITEQIRLQTQLQEQQMQIEYAMKEMPASIWTASHPDHTPVFFSESSEKLYGRSMDDIFANPDIELEFTHPEDREIAVKAYETLEKEGVAEFEYRLVHPDHSFIWVNRKMRAVRENGRIVRIQGIEVDITERKKYESQLLEAKMQAEAFSKAKSDFLSNMSHELRTPLTGIIGFADSLMMTPLNDEQRFLLQHIITASEALKNVVGNVLDISKIEAGKLELHPRSVDLLSLSRQTLSMVQYQAKQKQIQLSLTVDPLIPKVMIDPLRIQQILLNLVANAVKFTPERGRVDLTIKKRSDFPLCVGFEIADTGIGIPENEKKRIFEPFEQIDSSLTRKYSGTGIGLAISLELVQRMGSAIQVKSELGKGSTFFFDLELQPSSLHRKKGK